MIVLRGQGTKKNNNAKIQKFVMGSTIYIDLLVFKKN